MNPRRPGIFRQRYLTTSMKATWKMERSLSETMDQRLYPTEQPFHRKCMTRDESECQARVRSSERHNKTASGRSGHFRTRNPLLLFWPSVWRRFRSENQHEHPTTDRYKRPRRRRGSHSSANGRRSGSRNCPEISQYLTPRDTIMSSPLIASPEQLSNPGSQHSPARIVDLLETISCEEFAVAFEIALASNNPHNAENLTPTIPPIFVAIVHQNMEYASLVSILLGVHNPIARSSSTEPAIPEVYLTEVEGMSIVLPHYRRFPSGLPNSPDTTEYTASRINITEDNCEVVLNLLRRRNGKDIITVHASLQDRDSTDAQEIGEQPYPGASDSKADIYIKLADTPLAAESEKSDSDYVRLTREHIGMFQDNLEKRLVEDWKEHAADLAILKEWFKEEVVRKQQLEGNGEGQSIKGKETAKGRALSVHSVTRGRQNH